jgi:hypothetical protein
MTEKSGAIKTLDVILSGYFLLHVKIESFVYKGILTPFGFKMPLLVTKIKNFSVVKFFIASNPLSSAYLFYPIQTVVFLSL